MWKTVVAGSTALAIVGATFAQAQPGKGDQARSEHWRPSAEDIAALGDARIAALKAGLRLAAEQETHWPAVEAALRDIARQRADRFVARDSADRSSDPIERLARRAEGLESRGAALKKLAEAAAPLYGSLDDAQKRRFMMLAQLSGRRFGHWRGHHYRHRGHHNGLREPGRSGSSQPQ